MSFGGLVVGPPLDRNGACPFCFVNYVYQQQVVVAIDLPLQLCLHCFRRYYGITLPSSDMELLVDAPLENEDSDDDADGHDDDPNDPPPLIPEDTN